MASSTPNLPPSATKAGAIFARRGWWLAALLVAATILAYQPAWDAGFIWDDDDYVTHNPLLSAPDGLKRIWFSTDSPSQYFPLVYTTFRLEHALWGLNATGYHWVNLLMHAANALLVWRLLLRLGVPGAWLGAAIFALHPVQVESVAWISELKNVQSLAFSLLALLAWVEFVDGRRRGAMYALALIAYQLALFSKTTACTLPAALVLILWWRGQPVDWRRWLQVSPFVALGIVMGLVSIWWEKNQQGTVGDVYHLSLLERGLVAARALWFYVGKFLWPVNLTFNYPLWKIDVASPLAYAWLAALGAAGALVWRWRRRLGRGPEVALVFFVATLSPLLGFVMLYTFRYTFVTDHYQYVALIGPAALAGAGIAVVFRRFAASQRALQLAIGGALVLTLAVATWRQSRMYENLETLWTTTIARNPSSYMGHNNLGAIYLEQGRVDDAIARFERALEILPDHTSALYNLGRARFRLGRVDEAVALWQRVLAQEPNDARAHSDLSLAFLMAGGVDEAVAHARTAVQAEPRYAEAQNNLGAALLQTGELETAVRQFERAIELRPDLADAQFNLGTALLQLGRFDESIARSQQAIALRADFVDAHNNLGAALLQLGRSDEAIASYRRALELDPAHGQVRANLALALLQNGFADEAVAHFQALVAAQPESADARYNLAIALFQTGRADAALAQFRQLVADHPENIELQNNLGWALLQTGRTAEAIERFETVLRLQPGTALAHSNLALAWLRRGEVRAAIAHYESFLNAEPDHPPTLAALAWVLATWPENDVRQGAKAIALAQRANALTGGVDPAVLRSLAAAQAEGGRFAEAVGAAERALELAQGQSNQALAESLPRQISLYRAGAPFRQSVPVVAATP